MDEKDIAKLLEAGGNRWSKYGKDRIYIDVKTLGLEVSYYKTGNVCNATWQGEGISNADARRLLGSKVYVDCADGSLHVSTDFSVLCNEPMQLENVAAKFVEDALNADEQEAPEAGADAIMTVSEADAIMTAENLEAAYDAMAHEVYEHQHESEYLYWLAGSFHRRFGIDFDEMEKAVEPRLAVLFGRHRDLRGLFHRSRNSRSACRIIKGV